MALFVEIRIAIGKVFDFDVRVDVTNFKSLPNVDKEFITQC